MFSTILSMGLRGMDGYMVETQADITPSLPKFDIVGLPDLAVKEARERVCSAIKNSNFVLPPAHIVINLAPADLRKNGAVYDLPMTIAILVATSQLSIQNICEYAFIGQLSLDGKIAKINGVLAMVLCAKQNGVKAIFVPQDNMYEASVVDGIDVYGVNHLKQIANHFSNKEKLSPHKVDIKSIFNNTVNSFLDFSDVKGQESAKRALEIAASGGHNVLLIGSPGTGKTMLAQRMNTILPDMTFDEALEVSKLHSIAGTLADNTYILTSRPFRSPHHTISMAGLSGGGSFPRPGELSLAHNGILFLDELPEFRRDVLEVMRQPLEDGNVTISRVSATFSYPCNITLIASMNPCKCGYLGDEKRKCSCTPAQIQNYRSRISGPLLDRIDIHVDVASVNFSDLDNRQKSESSSEIKKRVDKARMVQLERYKDLGIYSNSQLTSSMLDRFCLLGDDEREILKNAFDNLGLSARAYSRILKVARTIADLDESEKVLTQHIAEAIQYRSLDRKYWG